MGPRFRGGDKVFQSLDGQRADGNPRRTADFSRITTNFPVAGEGSYPNLSQISLSNERSSRIRLTMSSASVAASRRAKEARAPSIMRLNSADSRRVGGAS